ncbi:Pre-mRNA-processing protein 40A [Spatholobus suberectus]|nr:Pre-mRNA-processing protein 40A [Spatholobus suberectus]
MANNSQPSSMQFRPVIQAQQGQPFVPMNSQQFGPAGHAISSSNVGMPVIQGQQLQYSQPMQQLAPRPMQPGHPAPSSQAIPMPYIQTNRPLTSIPPHSQQTVPPLSNHMPGLAVSGAAPYTFPPSYGQQQDNANALAQYQHPPQMLAPPAGQPWLSSASQSVAAAMSVQPAGVQSSGTTSTDAATTATNQQSLSDWQEHTSADGRRYYYNKRTRQSSWEKPLELMSPIERADASTVWKEFTSSEGRKYYYNKVTHQSTWSIPEELKLAREQAQKAVNQGMQSETSDTSNVVGSSTATSTAANAASLNTSLTSNGLASSPSSVTPIIATDSQQLVSGLSGTSVSHSLVTSSTTGVEPSTVVTTSAAPTIVAGSSGLAENSPQQSKMPPIVENQASQDFASVNESSLQDIEEAKRGLPVAGKNNIVPPEEKTNDDETLVYANKLEAKNAFKALLESVNVQSDWTWEQAMRDIINDKRYNALKTLGERKQAFNEYLGQRKKLEAEERRMKQKKAREEFTKMLEECKELTSSMRWSKAISMFENDERFKAVERPRDREDLFESYMVELERKEKENAAEEHRRNIAEYRKFLESCDYVKVNSHWRKIQDRLEDDDRYLRLEKIDRLLVFQDYIRDLEKEEEEQKRIQKDRIRRGERKNRDAFRKLLEEHVAAGILTAKTQWREYCLKVRDLPQYQAVASNPSGSTPKDLFEDVAEDLEKQYHEDKTLIKDTIKSGKIIVVTTSVFEDFKVAVLEEAACQTISEINLKLIFEELLERAKEKEEKEAKKRQRLADDFTNMLYTFKDITTSSKWEDCKPLLRRLKSTGQLGTKVIVEKFLRNTSHT